MGLSVLGALGRENPKALVGAKAVQLGPLVDGLRVIRSGITAQDRVVINGLQRIQPGMKVQAQNGAITPQAREDQTPVTYAPPAATGTIFTSLTFTSASILPLRPSSNVTSVEMCASFEPL